jgi:hypothetical protein
VTATLHQAIVPPRTDAAPCRSAHSQVIGLSCRWRENRNINSALAERHQVFGVPATAIHGIGRPRGAWCGGAMDIARLGTLFVT